MGEIEYDILTRGREDLEVIPLSLAQVLPEVQSLSRMDKVRLIQFLAQELERDDTSVIEPGQSYPVWSPDSAFSAANVLMQALEDEKTQQ